MYNKIFFLLFVLLLAGNSFAFGSVAKNDVVFVNGNESTSFTLLFWGDNESIDLWVADQPKNWDVIIDPQNFLLTRDTGEEYFGSGNDYVRAKTVGVFVKSSGSTDGNVIIGSRSGGGQSGLSVFQERYFNLSVKFSGSLPKAPEVKQNAVENNSNNNNSNPVPITPKKENTYFLAVVFILIIVVAFLIYKYS